jgi:menaquinone C8-methyltransferase
MRDIVMSFQDRLRGRIRGMLLGEGELALRSGIFPLAPCFEDVASLGLYLHIPFCRQICPYCPYNKTLYNEDLARRYAQAVLKEIDRYAEIVAGRPVTSFYIGGGTPTTMLDSGLAEILDHVYRVFNMQCDIHMESHLNDLSNANLATVAAMGVKHLSMGVEALQDHHLRTLCRPYTVAEAAAAIERAVARGFTCVNADLIFALPGQTHDELRQAASLLTGLGVDQIAAYPLFDFPYTEWADRSRRNHYRSYNLLQKRQMLSVLEEAFYSAGYERTSVWAFTRHGAPRYCSVTVPLYLGLGASGGSYLPDRFYLNTFSVPEYIRALDQDRMPIALSMQLTPRMQMAGWLYWRLYETRFRKSDFTARFRQDFDAIYGTYVRLLSWLGLSRAQGDEIVLTDAGAYWLHALQDLFSINYVAKLWGSSRDDAWPSKVVL